MPSPFPGMNPYLESASVWHDFHGRYLTAISEVIGAQVAPAYYVRIDHHLYVHEMRSPLGRGDALPYLEVITQKGRRVVTVIEMLSPTPKYSGPDRSEFQDKRIALLNRAVHYLEIDLLRGGPRMPIPDMPKCDYYVFLSRFDSRPENDFWPVRLRDPLPTIPIPLLQPHADAVVDLQQVLHHVYDAAQYEFSIYDGQPEPALSPENAEWAKQFVPAHS